MVCTKTLYNYIDLEILRIRNIALLMKLRCNTMSQKVHNSKRGLGTRIEDHLEDILMREEFGHYEIDIVIGAKNKDGSVLFTFVERQIRYYMLLLCNLG